MNAPKPLTPDEARTLTDKIKRQLDSTWKLVKEAYTKRADRVLGYGSWDRYCRAEFGTCYLRVPREERPEVIRSLRQAGMGVRPIASAMGISATTVWREAQQAAEKDAEEAGGRVPNETPTPPKPKPIPKPNHYLKDFAHACGEIAYNSIELNNLVKSPKFDLHRDELVNSRNSQRDNILLAHEQLAKLLPYFEDIPQYPSTTTVVQRERLRTRTAARCTSR